jgi:hypothetical protein
MVLRPPSPKVAKTQLGHLRGILAEPKDFCGFDGGQSPKVVNNRQLGQVDHLRQDDLGPGAWKPIGEAADAVIRRLIEARS